jgi:predicted TIM-barrel fold metal-dependent hydrolase
VDWLWSSYDTVVNAYLEITAEFSDAERAAMFSGNSERLYRI